MLHNFFVKHYYLPLIIIALGIFLRFWQLNLIPPPLSHDETAIGYNAYSILKTGRDEYGTPFPVLFRSFDDYKLPGMVYSTAVSVRLFGLNAWGVRFPSAFYGSLSIIVFFLITKSYLDHTEYFRKSAKVELISLATLFFSLSLWHINFSRQCFESNGAVFFLMLGILFLMKFRDHQKYLLFSAGAFAISIYFYYSVRLVIPFLLTGFLVSGISIRKNFKILSLSLVLALIILLPILPGLFSRGGFERIKMVSVTNDASYTKRLEEYAKITLKDHSVLAKVIYNRRSALVVTVFDNYLKNISYDQLFVKGAGRTGLLHSFDLPLVITGLICLLVIKSPFRWILVAWLFSAFLPGAFSLDQPNALRTLPGAPILAFISGLGFLYILNFFQKRTYKIILILILLFMFGLSMKGFYINYFYKFPYDNPVAFADGQKQMALYVKQHKNAYSRIVISGYYWRPYIFVLFWQKYDPATYQKHPDISGFDKYIFTRASWDKTGPLLADPDTNIAKLTPDPENTLYILSPADLKAHQAQLKIIDPINGMYAKNVFYAAVLK